MKKTISLLAGALILLTAVFTLVTCEDDLGDSEIKFTDVVYSEDGRQVKIYLDGRGVQETEAMRALNNPLARFTHDYFEVVFVGGSIIARAQWEIGQPAGISGVYRGPAGGGFDYDDVTKAVIFVGTKAGTLLGIGELIETDEGTGSTTNTEINSNTISVTFEVTAFKTELLGTGAGADTFQTGTGFETVAASKIPLGSPPVSYPIYYVAKHVSGVEAPATATYTIAGQGTSGTTVGFPHIGSIYRRGPGEVMGRVPRFMSNGQSYYVRDNYATTVGIAMTNNIATTGPTATTFVNPITFSFTRAGVSDGLFALTFQIPVYAITDDPSSSSSHPGPKRWLIRPAFETNLYLLDDGVREGGMVLLSLGVSGVDWIDIFTTGLGFAE